MSKIQEILKEIKSLEHSIWVLRRLLNECPSSFWIHSNFYRINRMEPEARLLIRRGLELEMGILSDRKASLEAKVAAIEELLS